MKPTFIFYRFFIVSLSILLSSNCVKISKIQKINLAVRKFEIKNSEKNILKEKIEEDDLLGSFNFISTPHFYPETGLNNNFYDLLGLKYNFTLVNPMKILPGQLSLNSQFELDRIARNIFDNFKKIQNGKKLKAFNVLTMSQRLSRSIESARILNAKLNKYLNITNSTDHVLPFNLSIYNNNDIKENDNLENAAADSLITYFIPKKYDREIFPIHFKFSEKICPKIANDFRLNLSNNSVKNTYKKLFDEIPFTSKIETNSFDIIDNSFLKVSYDLEKDNNSINENKSNQITKEYAINSLFLNSYQNFIAMNNFFEFTNKIKKITDQESLRTKTSSEIQNNKKSLKNFEFLDKHEHFDKNKMKFLKSLLKKQKEILQLINFDLFFVKNYSDDFVKLYSSEIFKFIMNVIYTYISPTQDEVNINLKNTILTNIFLKDYQVAGIYQILMQFKKKVDPNSNLIKTKELPQITYGTVITMNVMSKKTNLDPDNIINNFYIEILFDFKVIKTIPVSELLSMIAKFISNFPTLFLKACQ